MEEYQEFMWVLKKVDLSPIDLTLPEKLSRWGLPSISDKPYKIKTKDELISKKKSPRENNDKHKREHGENPEHRKRKICGETEERRRNYKRKHPSSSQHSNRDRYRQRSQFGGNKRSMHEAYAREDKGQESVGESPHFRGTKRKRDDDEDERRESVNKRLLRNREKSVQDKHAGNEDTSLKVSNADVKNPQVSPHGYSSQSSNAPYKTESEKGALLLQGLKKALKPVVVNGVVRAPGPLPKSPRPAGRNNPNNYSVSYSAQSRLKRLSQELHKRNSATDSSQDENIDTNTYYKASSGRAKSDDFVRDHHIPPTNQSVLINDEREEEEEEGNEEMGACGGSPGYRWASPPLPPEIEQEVSKEDVAWASTSGYVPRMTNIPDQESNMASEDRSRDEDEDEEPMEWDEIPEQAVLKTLKRVRMIVDVRKSLCQSTVTVNNIDIHNIPISNKHLFVVVDTNILIGNLKLIRGTIKSKIKGMAPKVVIPWQVLRELDYLKEQKMSNGNMSSVAVQARRAVNFLLEADSNILCQSQQEANVDIPGFTIEVPDDEILKCCLQIHRNGHFNILLTNDRNLLLKASGSSLTGINDDMMSQLIEHPNAKPMRSCVSDLEIPPKEEQGENSLFVLAHRFAAITYNLLATCIEGALRKEYKVLWEFHVAVQLPWTLLDVITCAYLQWSTVTGIVNCKDQINLLKQIHHFFSVKRYDGELTEVDLHKVMITMMNLGKSLPHFFSNVTQPLIQDLESLLNMNQEIIDKAAANGIFRTIEFIQAFEIDAKLTCLSVYRALKMQCYFEGKEELENETLPSVNVVTVKLPILVSKIKAIVAAMFSLKIVSIGDVDANSGGVREMQEALVSYLGNDLHKGRGELRIQDIVYFGNSEDIRDRMETVRANFQVLQKLLMEANELWSKKHARS